MQRFLPVLLNLRGRAAVVIGGGEVAEGKIRQLLEAEARVHVVAPELTRQIRRWAEAGTITVERRAYRTGDLAGYFVVVAGTDEPGVNAAIWHEAQANRQLVNVVDDPPHCNFIAPSIVRRGDLIVAISTAGRSPASAKLIRRDFERRFGPEWGTLLAWIGALDRPLAGAALEALLASPVLDQIRSGDEAGARRTFEALVAIPGSGPVDREPWTVDAAAGTAPAAPNAAGTRYSVLGTQD